MTKSLGRSKRFGLATWILGWGVYRAYDSIRTIKDNIRTLQEQNLLQQDQIIELSHYLNITYRHVLSNRHAITNLQIGMTQINKTLVAALSSVKFNTNIWNYYTTMKITPVVMNNFLLIILTIPLTDQSLEMDLYKVYNLPALHPKRKIEFTYK